MRRKLIAGNWKMNLGYKDSEKLAKEITESISKTVLKNIDVVVCPSYVSLGIVNKAIKESGIMLGAQNVYYEDDGAFTGEISAAMLKSVGCTYVIAGHSERRNILHETDHIVNNKIKKILESDLKPIICVGESIVEREDDIYEGIIEKQLTESLRDISEEDIKKVVIAYEPVWAIGTGLNATPLQISSMHGFISDTIEKLYNRNVSDNLIILYGGSVNEKNCKDILSAKRVDGALIGGASLKSDVFSFIAKTASVL